MLPKALPHLKTTVPGPRSKALARELKRVECPMVTFVGDRFPIFWERAAGSLVEDVDGNTFLDLTAAFGVASVGHTHPRVVAALKDQAGRLLHGMGDVHPSAVKVKLAQRLAELTPGDLQHVIFTGSGSEAVEAALKTAVQVTGRSGVIAFQGAYHGLGYGAVEATARRDFRLPVEAQRGRFVVHAPYPYHYRCPFNAQHHGSCEEACLAYLERLLDDPASGVPPVGAILLEPMQGRGGIIVPRPSFLQGLRKLCTARSILLIVDEIFTGFGRTGRQFGVDHSGVVPDLLCIGKAMAGGFPLSACIGTPEVMGRWGDSTGEALHTSTFLGNPLGCAMALSTLEILEHEKLMVRAARLGQWLLERVERWPERFPQVGDIRGIGLMMGLELITDRETRAPNPKLAWSVVEAALEQGIILLSGGASRNVLTLSPPLTMTQEQLAFGLDVLEHLLSVLSGSDFKVQR